MTLREFAIRLAVALMLGSIVGFERQYRQRMAGLRTNALVSVGAATFVMLEPLLGTGDPTRIAAARGGGMMMHALYSEDIEGTMRVEVIADVTVSGRADARLEKVVTRPGVEPGVSAVSWKIVPTDEDERTMINDA